MSSQSFMTFNSGPVSNEKIKCNNYIKKILAKHAKKYFSRVPGKKNRARLEIASDNSKYLRFLNFCRGRRPLELEYSVVVHHGDQPSQSVTATKIDPRVNSGAKNEPLNIALRGQFCLVPLSQAARRKRA
jgi:hypothetical protein